MYIYSADVPEKLQQIKMGAEAVVFLATYHNTACIIKQRVRKRYRLQALDSSIRKQRTIAEARILYTALEIGTRVPAVLFVDLDAGALTMEQIIGLQLKECMSTIDIPAYFTEIGRQIATLHKYNIIHGDLTTSNIIIEDQSKQTYLIDFGLSKISTHIEDKAVDLMVFKRTLDSTHSQYHEIAWNSFLNGYFTTYPESEQSIRKRLTTIQARTRYS